MADPSIQTNPSSSVMAFIHSALLFGSGALGIVLLALRRSAAGAPILAYGSLAVSLALVLFAIALVRPRIPARPTSQPPAEFWAGAPVRAATLVLWSFCEGSAITGYVGYSLTGWIPALASGMLGLAVLVVYRPKSLADV
jgi:hypothetical protein